MTRNFWIQHEDEVATWSCSLPALVDAPEEILALVAYIVDAGARDGVVVFDANSLERNHSHVAHMNNLPEVLLNARYGANMCWFDPADVLSCGLVRDLGKVLAATANADDQINEAFRVEGLPPVRIWGSALEHVAGRLRSLSESLELCISLHSDIWLPYVAGIAHPNTQRGRFFDNRELATAHTPRLNMFLKTVAARVASKGGRLALDDEPVGFIPLYRPWLSDAGIALEGQPPALVSEELSRGPWPLRVND